MPNQQVVWAEPPQPPEVGPYDPGDHTVDEVKTYVGDHPDQAGEVTKAEKAGKQRATLLEWLTSQQS